MGIKMAPIWQPSKELLTNSNMSRFMEFVEQHFSMSLSNYQQLHEWSVTNPENFWSAVWDFCGVKAGKKADRVFVEGEKFEDAQWFAGAQLNFAANLLARNDDHVALIFASERGRSATNYFS